MVTQALIRIFGRTPRQRAEPLYSQVAAKMKTVQAYARSHGGSIELVDVSADGKVYVKLKGACAACPLATVTLKLGVDQVLKASVPGVTAVIRV